MTDGQRRYIIGEKLFRGKTYKEIAAEMGITRQAISNDRRRHSEVWESMESWFELKWMLGRNSALDDVINKARETLKQIHSQQDAHQAAQEAHRAEHPHISEEALIKRYEENEAKETELARLECLVSGFLSQRLARRYDVPTDELPHRG